MWTCVGVGDENRDGLLSWPSLDGIKAVDRIRPIECRGQTIDGIGRDRHDLSRAERVARREAPRLRRSL